MADPTVTQVMPEGRITLRLSPRTVERLRELRERDGTVINTFVARAVEKALVEKGEPARAEPG